MTKNWLNVFSCGFCLATRTPAPLGWPLLFSVRLHNNDRFGVWCVVLLLLLAVVVLLSISLRVAWKIRVAAASPSFWSEVATGRCTAATDDNRGVSNWLLPPVVVKRKPCVGAILFGSWVGGCTLCCAVHTRNNRTIPQVGEKQWKALKSRTHLRVSLFPFCLFRPALLASCAQRSSSVLSRVFFLDTA